MAHLVALWRVLHERGLGNREIGHVFYNSTRALITTLPSPARRLIGWQSRLPRSIASAAARAECSQQRRYPGDWVIEHVAGDGQHIVRKAIYTECGILKLCEQLDAASIAPYMCLLDYVTMGSLFIGFERTTTLAMGGDCCDFVFTRRFTPRSGWPPEETSEWQNWSQAPRF